MLKKRKNRYYGKRKLKQKNLSAGKKSRYNNPFFNERRNRSRSTIAKILTSRLTGIFIFGIIILACWFFLYSGYFHLENISVSGQGRLQESNLKDTIWQSLDSNLILLFPDKNLFLINTDDIKNKLKDKYAFDELTVKKDWPRTLVVEYLEKKYAYIWKERANYYYIDAQGYIVTEATQEEIQNKEYALIENLATSTPFNAERIPVAPQVLDFIQQTKTSLNDYPDLRLEKFAITGNTNTVTAKLSNGPDIYFNTQADLPNQIKKLIIVKREKLKEKFFSKEYIDVRIGDNVYYR